MFEQIVLVFHVVFAVLRDVARQRAAPIGVIAFFSPQGNRMAFQSQTR